MVKTRNKKETKTHEKDDDNKEMSTSQKEEEDANMDSAGDGVESAKEVENKESAAESTSQCTTEDDEGKNEKAPSFTLRLVPLDRLLKPEIANPPPPKKASLRKSRNKKSSYIELSSDDSEEDQISISSTSESSDNEPIAKKRDKKKISNGNTSLFKEPMSPTKISKSSKNVSVNLNKMPQNVNKLMKSYRVESETSVLSWSESDDFENMIETSKIDREAVKQQTRTTDVNTVENKGDEKKKKSKKEKSSAKKNNTESSSEEAKKLPTRSRSTRNAAVHRKTVVDISESSSEEEEDHEVISAKKTRSTRPGRGRKSTLTSESDLEKGRKKSDDSDVVTEKKQDDHGDFKASKRRQKNDSSSDEEKKTSRSGRRGTSSSAVGNKQKSKKAKDNEKNPENKKEKTKSTTNNDNENSSSDSSPNESDHNSTDTSSKDESSRSSDGENMKKKKKKSLIDEIPDEEKLPTVDQKLRNRNLKYEGNKDFNKLKELIKVKKNRPRMPSTKEEETKEKQDVSNNKKKNQGKENHQNNNGVISSDKSDTNNDLKDNEEDIEKSEKVISENTINNNNDDENNSDEKVNKRKRLLSSSEEEKSIKEEEESSPPAKKKKKIRVKMNSSDSEYEKSVSDDSKEEEQDEDKEEDNSEEEVVRKRKRRVKNKSNSDDSDNVEKDEEDEDLDELEKGRTKDKRRKRIKKMASSDEDGEDGEKGKKASGRKAIRKIMRTDKLDVSTKEAAKIERERKQRIEERQNMYNQFYDERPEEAKEITQLVLDFDEKTKEPLLEVDKNLVRKLKPHQANGVKFMWDACFESLERCENEDGSGCILAHCMGLGKTLQVVTLVHTILKNSDKTNVNRVLVVCPLNTVLNWVNEFNIWLKDLEGFEDFYVYEINKLKQNADRANKLMEWHNDGGVMILSYDMFRNLTNESNKALRKKVKESLKTSLVDPGPDLVICDEGHLLKNEKTSISKAMMKIRSLRRIVLTGTPLQNNLKEYYCMVQFVKPNLLGKYQEYLNRFVNPITNGQYTDSTEYDIQIMRRRAHVLHKLLDGCVQRRDYSVLAPFLPPKHEYVVSIKLSPMQIKLYKYYMENKSRRGDSGRKGSILFQDFQNLQRIWTAPKVLRYNSDRYEIEMQRRKDLESEDESIGSIKDFIDDSEGDTTPTDSDDSSDDEDDECGSIQSDEGGKKKKKKKNKAIPLPRKTRAMAAACPSDHDEEEQLLLQQKAENPTEWWMQICPEEELNNIEHSSKLMLLFSILEKCEAIGDKLLVFSQSLYSLDVIEHFLNYIDEQTQQNVSNASFSGSWTLGQDYFRLDGSTPVEQRNAFCKHFNNPENPRARLFLISTRAGGLGINLVAANRVVIFDVSWNPSHDIQSIFRVYRFGQTKPCYIYRFLALGTMEEKIYERQVTKQAISKRVIDEQQIDRHYNQNDLQELYNYDLEQDDERILPILPKDRLFAEMLKKYEDVIYKYHEHDTLLENKEEETLGEEERKQAWEEFEAEKTRPQYPTYYPQQVPTGQFPQARVGPVTSNNIFGIRTDILLKLLSLKARLDNPSINDSQIKHAIPVLMQELYRQMDRGDLTLYQQLLALSSSLEVPPSYGGSFGVNEQRLKQTYNSFNSLPSTSSGFQQTSNRSQLAQHLHQQAALMRQRQRSPPRIVSGVIEID